jgi:NAD(P)-dependent dehydrogenase (short-subunit alcohol dehydrogenase family)
VNPNVAKDLSDLYGASGMTARSILITGCSSGIGYTCALGMKQRGWRVFATARSQPDLERLKAEGLEVVYLDYTEPKSIATCAEAVLEATGGQLFALFNNGAYAQPGAVEDLTPDVLRAQFEANVFGWHDLSIRLIPAMRRNGVGRIVQCSSVLGLVAFKWRGAYSASKFAIEALSDTMRIELAGSGVKVSVIEPGPIRSRLQEHAVAHFKRNIDLENSVHREHYKRLLAKSEILDSKLWGYEKPGEGSTWSFLPRYRLGPDAVLAKLVHAVESANPKPHYHVTAATHVVAMARRVLPARAMDLLARSVS